jgi:TRAP-type mannitol/chloroaromatic compound transport system permease large subunit
MSSQPPPLSQTPPLLVKKLSPAAKAPTRGSAFAAGYDIYSARATTIPARGKGMVETDLAIAVPEGTCEFFELLSHVTLLFFDFFISFSSLVFCFISVLYTVFGDAIFLI